MCLGVPAQIKKIIDADNQIALVDLSGVSREINIACVLNKDYQAQDLIDKWVLVHVGFALSIVDEEEAQKTLKILAEIGELSAAIEDIKQGSK
ncbi:[NiFe] hydrogenase metallocenter assembly protein HypC [uncultured Gammaproteobacteria bacterium]|jgi:hydrogenase expression/formation protein HypC|uniref:Protein belonging to Hydrogenaseexpression/formation protein, HupF/HypC n=2 Tax=Bathymodiolus azoricus thioautotrophic gill symbiont TaxID=235205 RepID=A0A1H6JKZ4_9GAMM|nr:MULTISPECIES: HypC/HybG/HupF family hydrogenase formation chaperone [Gammaproteobacteria]CAC5822176.1 [NiFe] hydrogenase metallocenter assembly protein HypC [uncultured Gammaproteobacteria bacterium]CAB5507568.1 [NiFe] hydrogenase metallocenter assembly protein HypC [Bathymodiolus azoricus thioautotrophic gill symbiont]CAC9503220.1 [NiFe] hydrogenase metallocenter assembly protein HypC [uncultured Gammaproteobacteria bacterium]CAC9506927.1 [NiFe] hydrogenase metallocenter assembly protein Hy